MMLKILYNILGAQLMDLEQFFNKMEMNWKM